MSSIEHAKECSYVSFQSGLTGYHYLYDELIYDIFDKVYEHYKCDMLRLVRVLGEGANNIVIEMKVYTSNTTFNKALRINKKGKEITHLFDDADETFLPKIEVRGDTWIVTPVYIALKPILAELLTKDTLTNDELEYVNYIIKRYAKAAYKILRFMHNYDYGVYDWKLSNFCLYEANDKIYICICDLDFTKLNNRHFYYTHSIYGLTGSLATLDCKIALKDIHDIIKSLNCSLLYDNLIHGCVRWRQLVNELNIYKNDANKYLCLIMELIEEKEQLDILHDDEHEVNLSSVKSIMQTYISKADKEITLKWRKRVNPKPMDKTIMIDIPIIRILPPSILETFPEH